MVLSIKHPDADRLARELARRQKKSITTAVVDALNEAIARENRRARGPRLIQEMREIGERYRAGPILDSRTPDEIIGYDENGLPS